MNAEHARARVNDDDRDWYGHELERHAARANAYAAELRALALFVQLLELVRDVPKQPARRLGPWERR